MANEAFDTVNEYFKQLGQITKEMDRAEMSQLWKRAKKGDESAKVELMEMNLRLVIPTAKRFQRPGMELMDLIEEGNLGLLQAIDKFEPEKGYRFSTYAIYWIEQYIRKFIEEQSGTIKIPSHAWGNLKKWFRAWNELKETNGRDPSLREMAEELNLTARQVKSIMDTLNAAKGIDSLTTMVYEEDATTLEDLISDDGKGNPHEVFLENESQTSIRESLDNLDERDRLVVSMRYGLDDNTPKTLGEVAELLSLSRERVRQIEERAVHALRVAAQKAGILEIHAHDFRTNKLHSAMRPRRKTNILGEEIQTGALARLLKQAQKEPPSKKIKKKKTPSKAKTHSVASKNKIRSKRKGTGSKHKTVVPKKKLSPKKASKKRSKRK
ncbi:MAG: sigma-70 family RNA polymerase sigma factor [Elusimicrobiaceae bacterium]|nr:sigma-70 family RNA polymerase sigma factor [Elusimicrobiaceae bacterium]